MNEETKWPKVIEYAKDILSLLVIPLLLWGMKLEVGNAERDLRIGQQTLEISRLETQLKETNILHEKIAQLTLKQGLLEGKMDAANGRLDEIKDILRRR